VSEAVGRPLFPRSRTHDRDAHHDSASGLPGGGSLAGGEMSTPSSRVSCCPQLGTELPFITALPMVFVVAFFSGSRGRGNAHHTCAAFQLFRWVAGCRPARAHAGRPLFTLTGVGIGSWAKRACAPSAPPPQLRGRTRWSARRKEAIRARGRPHGPKETRARGGGMQRAENESRRPGKGARRNDSRQSAMRSSSSTSGSSPCESGRRHADGLPVKQTVGRLLWEVLDESARGIRIRLFATMGGERVYTARAFILRSAAGCGPRPTLDR
jgi:hypothetical protein